MVPPLKRCVPANSGGFRARKCKICAFSKGSSMRRIGEVRAPAPGAEWVSAYRICEFGYLGLSAKTASWSLFLLNGLGRRQALVGEVDQDVHAGPDADSALLRYRLPVLRPGRGHLVRVQS